MKGYLKNSICFILIVCQSLMLGGCWDYSEMTDFEYVAGIALDKDGNKKEYILTLEVLEASVSTKSVKSSVIQTKGKTIHEAFRNAIKNTGKKLQLSHAKVLILSKDISQNGVGSVLDFINRDVEARNDMWMLISSMSTASQILLKNKTSDEIICYDLASAIKNSKETGQYIPVEVFNLINTIESDCISAMIPTVRVIKQQEEACIEVAGMNVFKKDKCAGYLSGEETLILQLMKGEKAKYVLTFAPKKDKNITLEIIKSSKTIKPKFKNDKIGMDIFINMDVALSELVETDINFIEKNNREELIKKCEKDIENRCLNIIKKLQNEYDSDVIGFGCIVNRYNPELWKKIKYTWKDVYKGINTSVHVKINARYSGLTNKNIKIGE